MRKKWVALLLLAALCLLLALPAAADGKLPLVCDTCGLLTQEQEEELNERAESYSEAYGCDIIVITVPDTEGYDVDYYSEEVYRQYSYGRGADRSGVILLLSMAGRDYNLAAHGYGNTAFTDYGKKWLMDDVMPFLKRDDWYGAFSEYLNLCADYLRQARDGRPVDSYGVFSRIRHGFRLSFHTVLWSLIAGLAAAFIVNGILKARMRSAVLQSRADDYLDGELRLDGKSDSFQRKEVTRIRRENGGGGHGTSIRSSGFSHRSGKF